MQELKLQPSRTSEFSLHHFLFVCLFVYLGCNFSTVSEEEFDHTHRFSCLSDASVRQRTPALSWSLLLVASRMLISSSSVADVERVCVGVDTPQPSRSSVFKLFFLLMGE